MNPWMLEDIEDGYIKTRRGGPTDEGYLAATEGVEAQDGL